MGGTASLYATINTQDGAIGARLDIAAIGMRGGCYEKTYFDVHFSTHMPLPTGMISYLSAIRNMNILREHLSKGLER